VSLIGGAGAVALGGEVGLLLVLQHRRALAGLLGPLSSVDCNWRTSGREAFDDAPVESISCPEFPVNADSCGLQARSVIVESLNGRCGEDHDPSGVNRDFVNLIAGYLGGQVSGATNKGNGDGEEDAWYVPLRS
jgi:hypothetical protein